MWFSCLEIHYDWADQVTPHQLKTPKSARVTPSCEVYGGFGQKLHGISAPLSVACWSQGFSSHACLHRGTLSTSTPRGGLSRGSSVELHVHGLPSCHSIKTREWQVLLLNIKSTFYKEKSKRRQFSRYIMNIQKHWKLVQVWIQTSSIILLVFQNQRKHHYVTSFHHNKCGSHQTTYITSCKSAWPAELTGPHSS